MRPRQRLFPAGRIRKSRQDLEQRPALKPDYEEARNVLAKATAGTDAAACSGRGCPGCNVAKEVPSEVAEEIAPAPPQRPNQRRHPVANAPRHSRSQIGRPAQPAWPRTAVSRPLSAGHRRTHRRDRSPAGFRASLQRARLRLPYDARHGPCTSGSRSSDPAQPRTRTRITTAARKKRGGR